MNEKEGDYIHVLTRVRSHLPLEGGYWNHGSDKSLPVVQYTNPWYGHMSTDSTTTLALRPVGDRRSVLKVLLKGVWSGSNISSLIWLKSSRNGNGTDGARSSLMFSVSSYCILDRKLCALLSAMILALSSMMIAGGGSSEELSMIKPQACSSESKSSLSSSSLASCFLRTFSCFSFLRSLRVLAFEVEVL